MKNIFVFILIASVLQSCVIHSKPNMAFVKVSDVDRKAQILAVNPPFWLAKPFIKHALKEDGDNEEVIALIKKVKKVRVLLISESKNNWTSNFKNYLARNQMEEWASINSDGQRISINAQSKNDIIHHMMIAVSSPTDQVYVQIKGKFSSQDISNLINITEKSDKKFLKKTKL